MNTIKIANPRPGTAKRTSLKRAEQYVRQGIAVIRDGELVFQKDEQLRQMRRDLMFDAALEQERGPNFIYGWNGDDHRPFVRHLPGRKRS